ncbi:MAG: 3'-5' exonuclease [Clostridia bacterium]|jgi:DNA polymerase III epsilon subunit-like protein|nr:3'-5' exonuclease [Clostridia bacterium]
MERKGKYLFFDIECSNGHSICSFGFCIVDKDLKLISKKDLLINPEDKFILAAIGHRPKIELAYPVEQFYKQDNFSYYYEYIKNLLTNSKLTLIGHSVKSDFAFLNMACDRYKLPRLPLSAYDTQKMFLILYKRPHVESLENIINQLEIDTSSLTFHRSCDDAKATFLIAKELCWQQNQTFEELLQSRNDCLFKSQN